MITTQDLPRETLSSLLDASAAINAAQDQEATMHAIARAAAAVLRSEASSVIMLDRARQKQVFVAVVGERSAPLVGQEFDMGEGLSGQAVKARKSLVYNDVPHEKAHYKDFDVKLHFQTRSLIAAPLLHKGEVLGVVELINPVGGGRFSESDRELAELFANLAAIAAANARCFDRLARENHCLRETHRCGQVIGDSPAMRQVLDMIRRVAGSATGVLLLGESGVGKELAARMIHEQSPRHDRAFIAVNCAALPETLLESELFGHEAGAFTGAAGRRLGRFELANEGTIFLDEIGEIAPSTQVKLLRVLQEKEFVRVGGTRTIGCDVRVIAATNRRLEEEQRQGRFRQDLFYRLNVFPVTIPPLRQRREDIPALAEHFLTRLAAEMKIARPVIAPAALQALSAYDFPGNIRELQNMLERACLLADQGTIELAHLPAEVTSPAPEPDSGNALNGMEKAMVLKALREQGWNQTRAAKALGVSRDNLRYRLKKYGIKMPQ